MKYIVFGVPGVGKTTVVKNVLEKVDIEHLHWGNLSEKVAKEKGLIKNIDELRRLSIEKQIEVRSEVIKQIITLEEESKKDILIETHAALKTPTGFFPGMTNKTIKALSPDSFIVIEADPDMILERRKGDKTRWRAEDPTLKSVKESSRVTGDMAITYAILAEGTVFFVENKQGEFDYASDKIVELIEKGRVGNGSELGAI